MIFTSLLLSALACAQIETSTAPAVPVSTAAMTWGVHITGWAAGSTKTRREFIRKMQEAGLNTVVVALKEYDGLMFVRDVKLGSELKTYVNAIPDLQACVRDFKEAGIHTIGRIVLFKDNTLARKRPDLAIKFPDGRLWVNDKNVAWVDPYRREVWEYNAEIAQRAVAAGFDEIQFDYIRFPSDGPTKQCRYSRADHTPKTAAENLAKLMEFFRSKLPGVRISVAVFGLTTTDASGLGIGQHLDKFIKEADYVSPMMYPSHYNKGEYGIADPNRAPYKTIQRGLRKVAALGADMAKLRPYLQDFSLGHRYGREEVRAQIMAAARMGVRSWILWNPQNRYTWSAIPKPDELPPADGGAQEKNEKDR